MKTEKPVSMGRHLDRKGWGKGPWDKEDDHYEWRHDGYVCLIVRGPTGALCGYVGLPPGHPWHGQKYSELDVDVHGGLTFAGPCHGLICHEAREGESDQVWWLGFDCAHAFDRRPVTETLLRHIRAEVPTVVKLPDEVYRKLAYVTRQVESLVKQASGARAAASTETVRPARSRGEQQIDSEPHWSCSAPHSAITIAHALSISASTCSHARSTLTPSSTASSATWAMISFMTRSGMIICTSSGSLSRTSAISASTESASMVARLTTNGAPSFGTNLITAGLESGSGWAGSWAKGWAWRSRSRWA